MFNLPKSCVVNRVIPKKAFYENVGISSSLRNEIVNKIEKVAWLYKISENTLGIPKTQEVEEIQIIEIQLKKKCLPKNILKLITKGIPYKILFIIKFDDEYCYSVKVNEFYFSEWNKNINFNFNGLTLEILYGNIVKKIIEEDDVEKNLEEIIENKTKVDELNRKIEKIKNKIKLEKQFNRKVELNNELNKLLNEMEELNNE